MSKGYSGLFFGTMGTSYIGNVFDFESYSDRGIDIPDNIKGYLSRLQNKGDYISGSPDSFSMTDVSIMSKETGAEFAKITVADKSYIIRGDDKGTVIPNKLLKKMERNGGTWDFHSHPHDDDCIPSQADRRLIARLERNVGQKTSKIVTPNGIAVTFNKTGVVSKDTVKNIIDENHKEALLKLFGG